MCVCLCVRMCVCEIRCIYVCVCVISRVCLLVSECEFELGYVTVYVSVSECVSV